MLVGIFKCLEFNHRSYHTGTCEGVGWKEVQNAKAEALGLISKCRLNSRSAVGESRQWNRSPCKPCGGCVAVMPLCVE